MAISPEQLVTDYIERLIQYPGALQVLDFADGRVRLVGVKALRGGALVGQQLRNSPSTSKGHDARVAAIYRDGQSIKPTATRSSRKATRCSSSPRATTSGW